AGRRHGDLGRVDLQRERARIVEPGRLARLGRLQGAPETPDLQHQLRVDPEVDPPHLGLDVSALRLCLHSGRLLGRLPGLRTLRLPTGDCPKNEQEDQEDEGAEGISDSSHANAECRLGAKEPSRIGSFFRTNRSLFSRRAGGRPGEEGRGDEGLRWINQRLSPSQPADFAVSVTSPTWAKPARLTAVSTSHIVSY